MTWPGDRLRAWAARLCDADTMERLVDPIVADLQLEYRDAERQGRVWTRRWIAIAGWTALATALALHACGRLASLPGDLNAEERQALGGALRWLLGAQLALAFVTVLPALIRIPSMAGHLHSITPFQTSELVFFGLFIAAYVPSTLPIVLPVSLLVAILCGLAGRPFSRRLRSALFAIASVSGLVSFLLWAWVIPVVNQAFRTAAFGGDLAKGLNELTLGELGRQLDSIHRGVPTPFTSDATTLAMTYHAHWALPFGCLALGLLALVVMSNWRIGRAGGAAIVCAVAVGYYALLFAAAALGGHDAMRPAAAVWLPNLVAVLLSTLFVTVASRQRAHRTPQHP